jgi:FMN phosphatase YigB (HAD superfamily)
MKNIKTFIFDLDGTLLTMDTDLFMNIYFGEMTKHFSGTIGGQFLIDAILASTKTTVMNTEHVTNEEVFWSDFNVRMANHKDIFSNQIENYYNTGYLNTKKATKINENMTMAVKLLKDKGYDVVIATNPLFPRKAILDRVKWAGFEPEDFRYITSFEKNHYCKPHLEFYKEVLSEIGRQAHECIMVGNDAQEDMVISTLGVKTWLVEDCLINRKDEIPPVDYKGTSKMFLEWIDSL